MPKAYAKCVEPGCGLIVYDFDEYRNHRAETGHHLDQSYQDQIDNKPWRGWCCRPCWYARKKECICRCRKAGHRKGVEQPLHPELFQDSTGLTEEQALEEIPKQ